MYNVYMYIQMNTRCSQFLQPEYVQLDLDKEMNSETYLLKVFFNILINFLL